MASNPTPKHSRLLLPTLLLLALALTGARCPFTLYLLDHGEGGSYFVEGCIEGPCLCPTAQAPLTGNFRLQLLPTQGPGPQRLFEISEIHWRISQGANKRIVTGRGLYSTWAPVLDEQRLVLELEIDGDPVGTIDSGVVPGGLAFPRIDIQALTPTECFQTGVGLRAAPLFH